mmetsp:Transcript_5445/g.11170  ORF Transcript_5445/g.11170 Transcript_5445/m.11170 type:complete len:101 (-) Transcript_5445:196-498(-)
MSSMMGRCPSGPSERPALFDENDEIDQMDKRGRLVCLILFLSVPTKGFHTLRMSTLGFVSRVEINNATMKSNSEKDEFKRNTSFCLPLICFGVYYVASQK